MRRYHYDMIDHHNKRTRIATIEGVKRGTYLTEVDKRFEDMTGMKATQRGVVVWFEDDYDPNQLPKDPWLGRS